MAKGERLFLIPATPFEPYRQLNLRYSVDSTADFRLNNLDVPGLVAHPERVLLWVSDIQVAEVDQAFEFIRLRESFAEVPAAKPFLANVKITDRVIGVAPQRL